ncbi:MAG: hypothetical protein QE271_07930 [Bacteriovoracaceae bacterium]|nr:hypothetical protein [Bacteriovoracaceae bacterium]
MKKLKINVLSLIAVLSMVSCSGGGGGSTSTTQPETSNNEPSGNTTSLTQTEVASIRKFADQFNLEKRMTKEDLLFSIHKNLPSQKKATYQLLDQKLDIDCEDSCVIKKKQENE